VFEYPEGLDAQSNIPQSALNVEMASKNWHWRTKDCKNWAKTWFDEQLVRCSVDGVKIDNVRSLDGDCEVGMRKSKLITIYDMRITTVWSAMSSSGETVTGTLVAVEAPRYGGVGIPI